jgi:outer membrane lipoprotein-sorting protein
MKKIFTLFVALTLICLGAQAQQADVRKAAERYKNCKTLVTDVTQTRHNVAVTKDAVSKGHFYYRQPNSESMVFPEAKEMLIAKDNTFTMVKDGRQRVAKAQGKGNNPFETLRDVFTSLLTTDNTTLTDVADVAFSKQGQVVTMTLTPKTTDAKAKRRMMFSECVVTFNLKSAELTRLVIHEPSGNYTQYDFSNYVFNAEVNSGMFDPQTVM